MKTQNGLLAVGLFSLLFVWQAAAALNIEDRVQCTANLNVRSTPTTSGTLVTTEASGSRGIIIDGPQNANGFTWWRATWDNGYTGWSVQDYLIEVTVYNLNIASSNPNSGVYIYVGPNDILGHADGTTAFLRYFDTGTSVTLIAPLTAGGNNFQKWQRNGSDFSSSTTVNFTMSANYTLTAVYAAPPPPTRTLTISSSNPNSGVSVTANQPDNNGNFGGSTTFTRVFNQNASVSFTAPSTAGGNNFQKWQRDGVDLTTSTTASVTMDANHTITAVYVSPPPVYTLNVESSNPNSGVYVYVGPNDTLGRADGTTAFARTYNSGTSVTLIAPLTAGGNNFQKWQRNGSDFSFSTMVEFSMSASYTLTAVYVAAPPVTHTLTVSSSNPNSGVSITANQPDNSGNFGGSTSFARTFNHNASVSFNAPSTAGGNVFQKWQRDGVDLTASTTATVTMDANHTITAVYGTAIQAAQTLDASAVTATAVRLNGNVNPNGFNTMAYFQYGISAAYGSTTPSANLGTTPQNTHFDVTGLSPGTTYHFRLVTSSGAGTAAGLDRTFTTTLMPGSLVLQGRVSDANGAPLAGAGVAAMAGPTTVAQTTSGADGHYQLPPLSAGVYTLLVAKSGYASLARAVTLNAATVNQDFQIAALPAPPSVQPVTRQPDLSYTIGPMGSALRVFDGTQFVPIVAGVNVPPLERMTIVLTHGWNSSPSAWAQNMAAQLRSHGVTPAIANIVCWDWHTAAVGPLPPEERTPSQGVALGQALLGVFGASYAQKTHFCGHSLGALVNAAAANYLHGDRTATVRQEVSPTPWPAANTHMTLFDQAELASVAGVSVLFDGLTANLKDPLSVAEFVLNTLQDWKPSMPVRSGWADNYISLFGFYQPNALNVALQKAVGYAGINAHSYPMTWYSLSIASPSTPPLGFRRSFEYASVSGQPSSFPPPESDFPLGDAYHQTPLASDQLELEQLPPANVFQVIVPLFGNGADAIVQVVLGTAQTVGDVTTQVSDTAQAAGQWISSGINYAGNVAVQGGQTLVSIYDSAVLRLNLTTTQSPGQLFQAQRDGPVADGADGDSAGTTPMIWLPLQIPTNARAMAFDFTLSGDPVDDTLVCGVGTNNLFSLEAKYIPTNTVSASRLLDVAAWAGKTNELFFGFMGGTSTNATLSIDNIRFYSLEQPHLEIARSGNATLLSWPSTAGGYIVETTPSLTSPSWESVSNAPAISADRYVLTNSWSESARFFRLRAR